MANSGDPANNARDARGSTDDGSRAASGPAPSAAQDGDPAGRSAEPGNVRGTLREMNREAGGVGGGLANMGFGSDRGCLSRLLPIILILAVIVVVLIILSSLL